MRKSRLLILFVVLCSPKAYAEKAIEGLWDCDLTSPWTDVQFDLSLNSDKTYKEKMSIFGVPKINSGVWKVEGDTLILDLKKTISLGKEEDNSQEFRRKIVSSSSSTLELTHEVNQTLVSTSCTKKS